MSHAPTLREMQSLIGRRNVERLGCQRKHYALSKQSWWVRYDVTLPNRVNLQITIGPDELSARSIFLVGTRRIEALYTLHVAM